jgi:serine/threonine-protein kinase
MAPEQAAASPNIDARADIYAWGIMAYELFAGRPPFSGRSPQAILAAQVSEAPEPVLRLRSMLPPPLAALIMRCLEKHAADRPQSAGEIIHTLDAIITPSGGSEPTRGSRSVSIAPGVRSASLHRIEIAVGAVALLAIGAWALVRAISSRPDAPAGPKTVAVLPLLNADTANKYLALGVGDELRARLTRASGLRVTSASTSNTYRGKLIEPRTIGQALDVAYVVLGEMRRSRDRIRVTTELVNTADGSAIWSESFDIVEQQLSSLPDSIAHAIAGVLFPAAHVTPNASVASTSNEEAYDLFLRAKFLLDKRGEESLRRSIPLFRESIALDSTFARPYAGLAMALMILPDYSDSPGDSLYALARVAADRAVALAPELAEAYAARGFLGSYVGRWNDGTRDLERAVQIDPQYGMAYKFLGQMHVYSGNLSEAEAPLKRATELDPMLPIVWHNLGEYYFSARDDAAALRAYRRALELDESFKNAAFDIARMLATSGKPLDGLEAVSRFPENTLTGWELGIRAFTLAKAGRVAEANAIATRLKTQAATRPSAAVGATFAFMGLGDMDRAVECHQCRATRNGVVPGHAGFRRPARAQAVSRAASLVRHARSADRAVAGSRSGRRPVTVGTAARGVC